MTGFVPVAGAFPAFSTDLLATAAFTAAGFKTSAFATAAGAFGAGAAARTLAFLSVVAFDEVFAAEPAADFVTPRAAVLPALLAALLDAAAFVCAAFAALLDADALAAELLPPGFLPAVAFAEDVLADVLAADRATAFAALRAFGALAELRSEPFVVLLGAVLAELFALSLDLAAVDLVAVDLVAVRAVERAAAFDAAGLVFADFEADRAAVAAFAVFFVFSGFFVDGIRSALLIRPGLEPGDGQRPETRAASADQTRIWPPNSLENRKTPCLEPTLIVLQSTLSQTCIDQACMERISVK